MANDRETENAKSTKGVESLKSSTPSPDVLTHPLGAYSHHSVSTSSADRQDLEQFIAGGEVDTWLRSRPVV